MNPTRHTRRLVAVLAGFGATLLMLTAAPAAFAMRVPPPGGPTGSSALPKTPTVSRTVVVGGMPGWQIALIAVGAALLASIVAVLADRARAARRPAIPTAA
jgi:hypothetical protein